MLKVGNHESVKFKFVKRNTREEMILEFSVVKRLLISNTFFQEDDPEIADMERSKWS